ncbi:MAG: hypothetical protein HYX20_01585 [Candidatus Yanofskybacteria bacterium]|nr:hypothetical protein [Candidatus Yanofskybacteria bacterium]
MDFKFTNEYPVSRLDEAVSFLSGPRLCGGLTSTTYDLNNLRMSSISGDTLKSP